MGSRKNALFIFAMVVGSLLAGFALSNYSVRSSSVANLAPSTTYFPSGAIWTQDISHTPVDPRSSALISWLTTAGGWGNNNKMQVDFGLRVIEAVNTSPMVAFRRAPGWLSPDSDYVSTIPLPQAGGIEGQPEYLCDIHKYDCHLLVVDRARGKLYEGWAATYADPVITSKFLAVWDLNRIYPPSGRGDQCTSADAAGYPITPLLFNANELASGEINHAIRFILPGARTRAHVFVHPATHAGGPSGPEIAPPMGAHFRLKASYDMSQLSPSAQVVARAMQKYGMFLADAGNIALTAQSDKDTKTKYSDVGFDSHSVWSLKVTDFEIIDMGNPVPLTNQCIRNP